MAPRVSYGMDRDPGSLPAEGEAAVVVAHPDDETLWCGGLILANPGWTWWIVTLCRGGDPDRAPRFFRVLDALGAEGRIADLDDGPDQMPLDPASVRETVMGLLPRRRYELVLTHGPLGEYTRHRRHEECSRAVVELWGRGLIDTPKMWLFAYEDGGRRYLPRVREDADRRDELPEGIWREKYRIIRKLYGFSPASWEARAVPRAEGFWCCGTAEEAAGLAGSVEAPSA